jgi:hypothetical protein
MILCIVSFLGIKNLLDRTICGYGSCFTINNERGDKGIMSWENERKEMIDQLLDRIAEVENAAASGEISTFEASIMIDTLEEELVLYLEPPTL